MFPYAMKEPADDNTGHVKDQIINIAGAKHGKILDHFHRQHQNQTSKKSFEKALKWRKYPGDAKSKWNKHHNIPYQIDHGVPL